MSFDFGYLTLAHHGRSARAEHLRREQQVRVNAYGGKTPYVTVVEDRGDTVLICKPAEFEAALRENRHPASIGFRREDVIIENHPPKKQPQHQSWQEDIGSKAGD